MKIRSVTVFTPLTWPLDEGTIASASRFLMDARWRLVDTGFEVQTGRMATPPFWDVSGDPEGQVLLEFARSLDEMAEKYNIDFVSIGPVIATTPLALLMSIHALPEVIAETKKIFSGVLLADSKSGVNIAAAYDFAQTVHKVAHSTPDGFGNLRLGALANIPPNVPFFPAAYHHGGQACFSIATEAADLALNTLRSTRSLNTAQKRLTQALEGSSEAILHVVDDLVDNHQIRFSGIDLSLAPYPDQAKSIAAAVESCGVDAFGGSGTLFATAFLASCVRAVDIPHIGFSGVMYPVLEDNVLAERAAEGRFSVHDLLLYSAVCGTGLDTIPIPGNTSPDEIGAIFLDMATLAIATNKPLTARLMPMPGLAVGEEVSFDFEYFANSRVLPVKNLGAKRLFEQSSFLKLEPTLKYRNR